MKAYLVIFLLGALLFGCISNELQLSTMNVTNSSNTSELVNTQPALKNANIRQFQMQVEGENAEFYFILENSINNQVIVADGSGNITVKDSTGNVVFNRLFNFRGSEFTEYHLALTGQSVGKGWELVAPLSAFQKGTSNRGEAQLILTLADGAVLSDSDSAFDIPAYSSEEVKRMNEEAFLISAHSSGQTLRKGNFEVTLLQYGFYKHLKYETWGEEVSDFRVDLQVKNIGAAQNSLTTYGAKIIQSSNQYERSFNGKLETDAVYPGVVKEGYLLFENIPSTLTGPAKIIVGTTRDEAYNELTFEFEVTI